MSKVSREQALALTAVIMQNMNWDELDSSGVQKLVDDPVGTGKKTTAFVKNGANVQAIVANYTVDLDADPFIPEGWKVESHTKGGQFNFDPVRVTLHLDEGQLDGKYIEGNKLRKKIVGKSPYNANLLDFYLAHPELIPESWKGKLVYFWGTIYRGADGFLYVRYLYWNGSRWDWHCHWLGNDWCDNNPAAVPSK